MVRMYLKKESLESDDQIARSVRTAFRVSSSSHTLGIVGFSFDPSLLFLLFLTLTDTRCSQRYLTVTLIQIAHDQPAQKPMACDRHSSCRPPKTTSGLPARVSVTRNQDLSFFQCCTHLTPHIFHFIRFYKTILNRDCSIFDGTCTYEEIPAMTDFPIPSPVKVFAALASAESPTQPAGTVAQSLSS